MTAFIGSFQPLWVLTIKISVLVLFLSVVGSSAVYLTSARGEDKVQRFPWPLSLAFGLALTMIVSLALLRILVLTQTPHFAIVSGGGFAAGVGVIAFAVRVHGLRATGLNWSRSLLFIGVALFATGLTLTPMLLETQVRYFAGRGTDATGYTRISKAMVDGWYFKPPVSPTLEERIYRPSRSWTKLIMRMEDRPGAYGLVGILSEWLRVNVFQAYLLAGVLMVALFVSMLLFIANVSSGCGSSRALVGAAGLLLVPASGLVANFCWQFLAQVICTSILVAVVPAIGIWMLLNRFARRAVLAGSVTASALACYLYDTRFSVVVACALAPAVALGAAAHFRTWKPPLSRVAIVLGGCAISPLLLHSWAQMFEFVPHFADNTPVSAFIFLGGLGFDTPRTVLFYAFLITVLVGGLTNVDRMFAVLRKQDLMSGYKFAFVLNLSLLVAVIAMIGVVAYLQDPYAIKRVLFFLLPVLIVLSTYYISFLLSDNCQRSRVPVVFCCFISILTVCALSLYRNFDFAKMILREHDRYGVLTNETIEQLENVRATPGATVVLATPVLPFLEFATILDDTGHPIYAPFSSWKGSTSDLPDALAQQVYKRVQDVLVARKGDTFYFSGIPPGAPTWRTFEMKRVAGDLLLSRDVEFDIVFPSLASGSEPLLTAGSFGDAFFVYAEYLSDDQARLKFNVWGLPDVPVSAPFRRGNQVHHVRITADFGGEMVGVFVDGEAMLHGRGPIRLDHMAHAAFGLNNIGGGLTTPAFTGRITNVRGI